MGLRLKYPDTDVSALPLRRSELGSMLIRLDTSTLVFLPFPLPLASSFLLLRRVCVGLRLKYMETEVSALLFLLAPPGAVIIGSTMLVLRLPVPVLSTLVFRAMMSSLSRLLAVGLLRLKYPFATC